MLKLEISNRLLERSLLVGIAFCFTLILIFFATTLFSATPSHASLTNLNVNIASTTILSVNSHCSMSLSPTTPFGYCDITSNVISNNPIGYNLYVSMSEEAITSNDNTCLRHSGALPPSTTNPTACTNVPTASKFTPISTPTDETGSFITLPSGYATNPTADLSPFTKGTWGASYTSTPTTNGTNYTKFTGIPSYSSTPLLIKETYQPTASDDTTLRFAAHYNLTDTPATTQVTGGYQGVVLVTAVNKPTLFTADTATMQNFNPHLCSQMSVYTPTTGEILANSIADLSISTIAGKNTAYLKDSRNNQLYRIRKLPDNNCWMIDNLKLYNVTLYGADQGALHDSDIASGTFTLPATLNTAGSSNESSARVDDIENGSYTQGSTGYDYCGNGSGGMGTVKTDYPNTTTGCGYLYNWYAATAGEGTSDLANTTVTDSICPKNWDLPTGGPEGQFENLNNTLDLTAGGSMSWQGVYSGYLNVTGFGNQGVYGNYWSATAYSSPGYAYRLRFTSSSVAPTIANDRTLYGRAVRCLL